MIQMTPHMNGSWLPAAPSRGGVLPTAVFFLPIPPVLSVLSIAGIVLDAILAARFCKRGAAADRVAADGIPMA